MSQSVQCPALLIYEDGTGRLVVTSDLPAMLDEVSTRYLIGDILIDRRELCSAALAEFDEVVKAQSR